MPIYDYECKACGVVKEDVWAKIDESKTCPACGAIMNRLLAPTSIITDLTPYLDENISSSPEPVLVKSRQHRKQLMRENELYERG